MNALLDPAQLATALSGALRKLDPRALLATPVMLVVEVGAVLGQSQLIGQRKGA